MKTNYFDFVRIRHWLDRSSKVSQLSFKFQSFNCVSQLLWTQPKSESVLNWSILVSCHWNCSKWICTATKANLWDSWFSKIHYWEQWAWPKEIFSDSVTRSGFERWLSYSSFVAVWHWIVLIESQHFFSQTVTFETWLNWLWLILRSRNLDFLTQFLYFIVFLKFYLFFNPSLQY